MTDRSTPFDALNASRCSCSSCSTPLVSSGSSKIKDCPPSSNLIFLNDAGVGEEARGYNFGSKSRVDRGAFKCSGGRLVVVVVVVVTTVVQVAGA